MTDTDVTNLVGVISPTMPIEVIRIFSQPSVTRVPQGLTQFTNLKAVLLPGNGITSANASDFNLPLLQEIQLQRNAIATVSGHFALASPFQSDGAGSAYFSLNNNAALTSLSNATFSLAADNVVLYFQKSSLTSVNGDAFTLSATQKIEMWLFANKIASVSGNFNLTATNATNGDVTLFLTDNELKSLSPATFYLNGPKNVNLGFAYNSLTSVTAEQITLKGKTVIYLDLGDNQLTSIKLAPDTNPPLSEKQRLDFGWNNFNGTIIDCNDLGLNKGAAYIQFKVYNSKISGVKCGAGTPLDTAKKVNMDWGGNALTSLPAGSFNFAGKVELLRLSDQDKGTYITSIEPGSLPREIASLFLIFMTMVSEMVSQLVAYKNCTSANKVVIYKRYK